MVERASFDRMGTATATATKTLTPLLMGQKRFARILAAKPLHELNDCQCLFHGHLDLMVQSKAATPQPICGVRSNPLIRCHEIPQQQ
jgi:hypothetical protein